MDPSGIASPEKASKVTQLRQHKHEVTPLVILREAVFFMCALLNHDVAKIFVHQIFKNTSYDEILSSPTRVNS